MNNRARRFLETGQMLGADQYSPTVLLEEWRGKASAIRVGWLFGSIVVMTADGLEQASVRVSGDSAMAGRVQIEQRGPNVDLDGMLPFLSGAYLGKQELSQPDHRLVVGGDVRMAVEDDRILVNGGELDLVRAVVVVVEAPPETDIHVGGLIGRLSIKGNLKGALYVSQIGVPRVFAEGVGSFDGRIAKYGEVRLGAVRGDLKVQTWLGGLVEAGSVGGNLNITAFDGGRVVIDGGTSEGMLTVEMGGGYAEHRGTVIGAGHSIYMRGPGHAVFPSVRGGVSVDYPIGVVDLNGQRHGKFRQTVSG